MTHMLVSTPTAKRTPKGCGKSFLKRRFNLFLLPPQAGRADYSPVGVALPLTREVSLADLASARNKRKNIHLFLLGILIPKKRSEVNIARSGIEPEC